MSEEKKHISLFGYPLKDWVIIAALFGSSFAGGTFVGSAPGATSDAINNQTALLAEELKAIRVELRISSQMTQRNALRIDLMESAHSDIDGRLDSIYQTLMDGLENLDGYFRGRLDQIRGDGS